VPTISMFFGIIIRMYCGKAEHNSPHFNAYYNDFRAVVDVQKCEITEGNLPKKQSKLVLAWAEIHQEDLLANWRLASNGEMPFTIEPLK
jgi:hypothetical protein